jgi:hypothetical protein
MHFSRKGKNNLISTINFSIVILIIILYLPQVKLLSTNQFWVILYMNLGIYLVLIRMLEIDADSFVKRNKIRIIIGYTVILALVSALILAFTTDFSLLMLLPLAFIGGMFVPIEFIDWKAKKKQNLFTEEEIKTRETWQNLTNYKVKKDNKEDDE